MTTTPHTAPSPELADQHLNAVLRASGSALRHYTTQKTLDEMRAAMRTAMEASEPTPPKLFLNGFQLRAALDFIAPDGDDEQLESEVCIQHGPERTHDEGTDAAGMYCWLSDYPDEGSIRLDDEAPEAAPVAPVAPAPQPSAFGDEDHVSVPRALLGAACSAIDKKRDGAKTLSELRRYTFGDLSAAAPKAAPQQGEYPDATPGLWFVRKREVDDVLRDCFVAAPDCLGLPYDAEILGDDEYRDFGNANDGSGIKRKLADCELIVSAVNAARGAAQAAPASEVVVDVMHRSAIAKAVYQQVRIEFGNRIGPWNALDALEQQRVVDSIRGLIPGAPAPVAEDAYPKAATAIIGRVISDPGIAGARVGAQFSKGVFHD